MAVLLIPLFKTNSFELMRVREDNGTQWAAIKFGEGRAAGLLLFYEKTTAS
jgi:hypothetical protein